MTIEGRRSREGPKDATQQPTNGGAQLEAEALAERRRQANGQHDNQRPDREGGSSGVALKCRGVDLDAEGVKQATLQPIN